MRIALAIFAIGAVVFYLLSIPARHLPFEMVEGDVARGEYLARAAGCASCHGEDYAGGDALYSPFGTFYAPNITPEYYNATAEEFGLAVIKGVADGKHLYPAFPYSSYAQMTPQDVSDLYAFVSALPSESRASRPHELRIYAKWRRPLGIWKKLRGTPPKAETRGAYLVEALGHCEECHTPRHLIGTLDYGRKFEGGKVYDAAGDVAGQAPNLRTGDSAAWSASEIASYLSDGFTPEYDSAGGAMVEVIENTSKLSADDRDAIAEYLVSLHE